MSFRNTIAWQKSIDLVVCVYDTTANLPENERFGLQSQMRRSAVSIPSNIAEGYGRGGTTEYLRFIDIALGELRELQTQIEISRRLSFIDVGPLEKLADEVGKLLYSVRKGLKEKTP